MRRNAERVRNGDYKRFRQFVRWYIASGRRKTVNNKRKMSGQNVLRPAQLRTRMRNERKHY